MNEEYLYKYASYIKIHCKRCEYSERFALGAWDFLKGDPRITSLTSLVKDPAALETALRRLRNGGELCELYTHQIYGCPDCGSLNEGIDFSIIEKKDGVENFAKPEYKCPVCGHIMILLNPFSDCIATNWPCPSCGNKELQLTKESWNIDQDPDDDDMDDV